MSGFSHSTRLALLAAAVLCAGFFVGLMVGMHSAPAGRWLPALRQMEKATETQIEVATAEDNDPFVPDGKVTVFRNQFYEVTICSDRYVRIKGGDGEDILSAVQLRATYGRIYDVVDEVISPGTSRLQLRCSDGLEKEDSLVLQADSFAGGLTDPLTHKTQVEAKTGDEVWVDPAPTEEFSLGSYLKEVQHSSKMKPTKFALRKEDGGDTVLKCIFRTDHSVVGAELHFAPATPTISVKTNTSYTDEVQVFEETLSLRLEVPIEEVYRKNSQMDVDRFEREYWLGTNGFLAGDGKSGLMMYHVPEVSSVRLYPDYGRADIKLDSYRDRSFMHGDGTRRVGWVRHASEFSPGCTRSNSFDLIAGCTPPLRPRLMLQPYGFLATHVWTEHTDGATLDSHRAAYFGRSDIVSPKDAVGGFVKYDIPVTKSIYYANPAYHSWSDEVALKECDEFLSYLKKLRDKGHEICIHSVYPSDSPQRSKMAEALSFMRDAFDAKSWIDHGYRDVNMSMGGYQAGLPQYVGDLWEEYGVEYFWTYSSEAVCSIWDDVNLLQTSRGDHLNTPLYWQHPSVLGDSFYVVAASLVTENAFSRYTTENLHNLVEEWGVFINHTYPPRVDHGPDTVYLSPEDGLLVTDEQFERLLFTMRRLCDRGDLYLATMREMMDYWTALECVRMRYLDCGAVKVINESGRPIHGLSLVVEKPPGTLKVAGIRPESRVVKDQKIFWFDLDADDSVVVRLRD